MTSEEFLKKQLENDVAQARFYNTMGVRRIHQKMFDSRLNGLTNPYFDYRKIVMAQAREKFDLLARMKNAQLAAAPLDGDAQAENPDHPSDKK